MWYTVENFDASIECTFLTCLVVTWSLKIVLLPCLSIANGLISSKIFLAINSEVY